MRVVPREPLPHRLAQDYRPKGDQGGSAVFRRDRRRADHDRPGGQRRRAAAPAAERLGAGRWSSGLTCGRCTSG